MANARAKLYYTKEQYLDSLPVKDGNIIFVADSRKVCLDMRDQRYSYNTIQVVSTLGELEALENPADGFYYVDEIDAIWRRADERWNRITPANIEPVVYGEDVEHFPIEGKKETLYFTDNGIYNWKEQFNKYNLIANANQWDSIENE